MGTYTIACKSPEQFHIISVMVSKDQPLETPQAKQWDLLLIGRRRRHGQLQSQFIIIYETL